MKGVCADILILVARRSAVLEQALDEENYLLIQMTVAMRSSAVLEQALGEDNHVLI